LGFPAAFYDSLLEEYLERRKAIVEGLSEIGFEVRPPDGAYYVMAGIGRFGYDDDVAFARHLIESVAVATVPASSFFHDPALGRNQVRFSFPKRMETLRRGLDALRGLRAEVS
jgi:aminotransferase